MDSQLNYQFEHNLFILTYNKKLIFYICRENLQTLLKLFIKISRYYNYYDRNSKNTVS